MKRFPNTRICLLTVGAGSLLLAAAAQGQNRRTTNSDDDRGALTSTPYYEKDAWYDVSEWFDGNDYNPTDESLWEWDREVYTPGDNDRHNDPYGYDTADESDNWFYDYYDNSQVDYDDYNNDRTFEYGYAYLDFNNDNATDALYSWYDSDGDGVFDEYTYVSFNEYGRTNRDSYTQKQDRNKAKDGREHRINGTVARTKTVTVRDDQHLVAELKDSKGESTIVDLGPKGDLEKLNLSAGDTIAVSGPRATLESTHVILAREVRAGNGRTLQINRDGRTYTGTVQDTRTVDLMNRTHTLAMIEKDGKRCVIDLGPTDNLKTNVSKGTTLKVQGVPIRVNDTLMLLATKLERNGEMRAIERPFRNAKNEQSSSNTSTSKQSKPSGSKSSSGR